MRKLITDQILEEILDRNKQGELMQDLAKEYGFYPTAINNAMNRKNIGLKAVRRKSPMNEGYFSDINTEEKAYLLGILFADGCIRPAEEKRYNKGLSFSLVESDKYIVQLLRDNINPKIKILTRKQRDNWSSTCSFSCRSEQIVDDLIRHGMKGNKIIDGREFPTHLELPMIQHFIRGYFDGDGCIYTNEIQQRLAITIYSPCLNFLTSVQHHLSCLNIESNIRVDTKNRITPLGGLHIYKNKSKIDFLNYIYRDSSIYLIRKKVKFDSLEYKEKDNTVLINSLKAIDSVTSMEDTLNIS